MIKDKDVVKIISRKNKNKNFKPIKVKPSSIDLVKELKKD